jgi:hypothetical protein
MSVEKGTCRLCLLEAADLCDSHYIPRAMYKYNRAAELRTPHPVVLAGGKPKQGTAQIRDYVLCQGCENRFRLNGETWVLANIPHDYGGPFPLQVAANAIAPTIIESDRILIAGKTTPGFDIEKLIYFAASIFWRGAAHRWGPVDGSEVPVVHLGPYQEELRLFLLGQAPFPADVSLTVMLWPFEKVPPAALFPCASPVTGWKRYWFYISGLGFVLDFGKSVPTTIRSRSTSHSPEQFVTISKQFGDMVWKSMRELVGNAFSGLETMLKEISAIRSKTPQQK